MNASVAVKRWSGLLVLPLVVFPLAAIALESESPVSVRIYADRYDLGGRQFADLTTLEAWVEPLSVRALRLEPCGQAAAKRLGAAVERFYGVYTQGIEIRELDPRGPECAPQAASDAAFLAVDENGRSTLP